MFSNITSNASRRLSAAAGLALAAALSLAVIIIANALITKLRIDLTENRLFTLSPGSLNIISALEEPVALDLYFSSRLLADLPQLRNYGGRVRDLLEEFAARSNGGIRLAIIDPQPFSEQEDQAVAAGLQGVPVNAAGDRAYFGLVGSNATDDEAIIPFFQATRQAALEYDITKLIYNLANPQKRTVGVLSSLPLFGNPASGEPRAWAIIDVMREFFNVRELDTDAERIADDIDVLMLVHPKQLQDKTLYAIDQYLLGGGKGLIFIDPLAEADPAQADSANPFVVPELGSNLKTLLDAWGLSMATDKIAADRRLAMRVQTGSPRGPLESDYLPWLRITEEFLSADDFTASELQLIHLGTAGIIEQQEESTLTFTPLIQTSTESMPMERDLVLFQRDPNVMLAAFASADEQQTLAVRLNGTARTAYPDGPPPVDTANQIDDADPAATQTAAETALSEGELNLILVADTDILADIFWTRRQSFFGIDIPQTIANNGDFVINALENLAGSTDLISLRSRGEFSRPFTKVEAIRRAAEQQFRAREQQLQAKLDETERKIIELQRERGEGGLLLSPEQQQAIENFRLEQVKTRKELRTVQHELQKNIDRLGVQLKFFNIVLLPLLVIIFAIVLGIIRARRMARPPGSPQGS